MQSTKRQNLKKSMFAAVLALLLACLLTWPVPIALNTTLVGHPGNDTWNHVWGYWWVSEALSRGEWPIRADDLLWPYGGTLYFIDTMQAIFSWPIQILLGPAVAFNLVIIFQIALCGFAAWLLAWRLSGDSIAALIALIIYEMSPHLLGQAYNGISETVCAGWFPLTLWALLKLMDRPTWKGAFLLGGIAGLCVLTSWYYGLFAAIASAIILLWSALRQGWLYEWKKLIGKLIVAAAFALLLFIGPFLSFQNSLNAEDALVSRDPEFVERSLLNHNITDLLAFFRPSTIPSPDLFGLYGEELIIVIYLGWIGLFLVGVSIFSMRQSKNISPWLWLGGIFFVFSLGPYLNIGGEYVELYNRRIPLPFLALYKAFPIFDRISHPFRFVTGVNLAIALLATHGLRGLLRQWKERQKIGVIFLLGSLIWLEFSLGSPAHLPIPISSAKIPAAYQEMKEDSKEGAVLDLPLTIPNLERAVYVWYQTDHKRPVPWGLNDPMPQQLRRNQLLMTLIAMESTRAEELAPILPELDLVVSSRVLIRQGYRYIVLHEHFYPPFKRRQVADLLTALYGKPKVYDQDALLVYQLGFDE